LPGFDPSPWKLLAEAEIFAHPSSTEAQPLAILEAMGIGMPIVTTRWDGVDELVEDGVNGFVTAGDPASFADALERLMRDGALRARMGRASMEKAKAFDLRTSVFPKYLRLIEELAPRAVPVPRRPVEFSIGQWADQPGDPIRLVIHRSFAQYMPSLGVDYQPLIFDDIAAIPPPVHERYLIVSWGWPDMIEQWLAVDGSVALNRAAYVHTT